MTSALLPVEVDAPLLNPSTHGLDGVTKWNEETGPPRWLASGIDIVNHNFGGEGAFGIWEAEWCASEEDLTEDDFKDGIRPADLATFLPLTVWAFDSCDLRPQTRNVVDTRVLQILRMEESPAVEREFADRLIADSDDLPGAVPTAANAVDAVSQLENMISRTGAYGFIHASTGWAAIFANANLLRWTANGLVSPLGHRFVFGGGYIDGLGNRLVATSQPYGWRTPVTPRPVQDFQSNTYAVVAERSLVIGYEAVIGAVTIS